MHSYNDRHQQQASIKGTKTLWNLYHISKNNIIYYITDKYVLHNMYIILTKNTWETFKKLLIQLYCTHEKK